MGLMKRARIISTIFFLFLEGGGGGGVGLHYSGMTVYANLLQEQIKRYPAQSLKQECR